MQLADWCVPWIVTNDVENLVLQALQFQKIGFCCELPGWAGISHYTLNDCFMEG